MRRLVDKGKESTERLWLHRYDNFRISAHMAASAADIEASRPQLTAFSEWLLGRFNVSASAAAAPAAPVQQLVDTAAAAEALQAAFANPADAPACAKLRAADKTAPAPLLTLVVRTDKLNGQVSCRIVLQLPILGTAAAWTVQGFLARVCHDYHPSHVPCTGPAADRHRTSAGGGRGVRL